MMAVSAPVDAEPQHRRPPVQRWWERSRRRTPGLIAALTWVIGLLTVISALLRSRHHRFEDLASLVGRPMARQTTATATALLIALGLLLMYLASGLRRRKRRAWRAAIAVTSLVALSHLAAKLNVPGVIVSVLLIVVLVVAREQFYALGDPTTRWYALRVTIELLLVGVALGMIGLQVDHRTIIGHPSLWQQFEHVMMGFVGVDGPVQFRTDLMDDVVAYSLAGIGLLVLFVAAYLFLRSAQPRAVLTSTDEQRLRDLLATQGGRDSLGYFALRRDKSVIWSPTGKAAVTYRVDAGVALASGDPIGDPEAWPGAIEEFLDLAAQHAWVPAVIGASEQGATVYSRHGLDALELGDEAIVDTTTFSLSGRPMRGVRQAVKRVERAGYDVQVRRAGDLSDAEMNELVSVASAWRGGAVERGFSMALSRLGDPTDGDCVVTTAHQDGKLRGLLHFVPWGTDGLSLDLMRRDRSADNGLNELLIVRLIEAAAADLGVQRVSLNFAAFRSALERGERIGAGPVLRLWRKLLVFLSRWWQIESLYRFNVKFRPDWQPRFLSFPATRDLPRIAFAALEAEAFFVRPRRLQRMLRRDN
jgi:lysyl-tRNA synthetase class 2